MIYLATSRGKLHKVEVWKEQGELRVRLDTRDCPVDLLPVGPHHYSLLLAARSYEIDVLQLEEGTVVLVNGQPFRVEVRREAPPGAPAPSERPAGPGGVRVVTAPLPGKVVKLLRSPGERVAAGEGVLVIEAMKMENELKAPATGIIAEIRTAEGKTVNGGEVLVVIG